MSRESRNSLIAVRGDGEERQGIVRWQKGTDVQVHQGIDRWLIGTDSKERQGRVR